MSLLPRGRRSSCPNLFVNTGVLASPFLKSSRTPSLLITSINQDPCIFQPSCIFHVLSLLSIYFSTCSLFLCCFPLSFVSCLYYMSIPMIKVPDTDCSFSFKLPLVEDLVWVDYFCALEPHMVAVSFHSRENVYSLCPVHTVSNTDWNLYETQEMKLDQVSHLKGCQCKCIVDGCLNFTSISI